MPLKKILILVIALVTLGQITFAQKTEDYSASWKKIAALEKKGLTASALKEVITIFNLAIASGNDAQQIKAAMYQMRYRNRVEEDNNIKNISYADTLITRSKGAAKNILQSMQAELLWNYRLNNRYRLYNRTQLAEENSSDIATWSLQKLNKTMMALYKSSLQNEQALKSTSLNGLDAIIQKGKNTQNLRPTLYDFLAYRALAYFMEDENEVTRPAYKFILDDEKIFSPVPVFIQSVFTAKDSISPYYNALLLLQDILAFHINDANPDALMDADLARLAFANAHAVFSNKDKLYEAALKNIETSYGNNPLQAQAMFLRASLYKIQGEKYDPVSRKDMQFDIKKAKELCEQAIDKFPAAEGALNCRNLLAEITAPVLELSTEKVNIPGQPFLSLVKYKNIRTIYLHAIRISREDIKRIEKDYNNKLWQPMANIKAVKSWNISLPNPEDYQQHATEIKTDGLPAGIYMILASIAPDFSTLNNLLARQITYISNISYITNNKDELYVLDRGKGQPLQNAEVQLWQKEYNYTNRDYEEIRKEKYITGRNGYIKIKKQKNNNYNYYFQIKYKGDELFTDDNYYNYHYNNNENPAKKTTFLFTDRSIYRPGQTVFFKGIVISSDSTGKKNTVTGNYRTAVKLYDANRQEAGRLQVLSNEYGSYTGSFTLPENGLNGQFYITDSADNSTQFFNVEEYKRPQFFVEIKKPGGTYRINDSIQVTGFAKAFAGNNIDGAKVTYRVVRKIQYPLWRRNSYRSIWPPYGQDEAMEISNGETTSDANGEFFLVFKAIPDETSDKKDQPVFYYEINADVTDISGETRSSNASVAVAYQALQLDIIAADKIPADSLLKIKIASSNMNNLFERTTVTLVIQKLQPPDNIFRSRYWEMPDQFVMAKDEFNKNFPYDAYADEDQADKWPVQHTLLEVTDTTSENSAFKIPISSFEPGWYKLIAATKDKYGEEIKAEKYILLTGNQQPRIAEPVTLAIKNKEALPGGKISYLIETGFEKIWLIHSLSKTDQATTTIYPVIENKDPFKNEIAVTENDRGGMTMSYAFVQHNRLYSGSQYFSVPWSNKDLNITYETFRDKILPGSEEKWKIKIAGNRSEKVAAETLISMYDASLDQFKAHRWPGLASIWPVFMNPVSWTSNGFISVNSEEINNLKKNDVPVPVRSYDAFIASGWNEGSYYGTGFRDETAMSTKKTMRAESMIPAAPGIRQLQFASADAVKDEEAASAQQGGEHKEGRPIVNEQDENKTANNNIQVRANFNETAFFFPNLNTDANGNIEFSFTIPEALTTWKMMTLAHTKDLASIYSEKTVITQKQLMVQPNPPRFLREGDQMEFSAKIVNLSDSEITGTAQLELFDAATNKSIDGWFKNIFPLQYFTAAAGQSTAIKFPVEIPFTFNSALTWRIKASSADGAFTDGEEAALPVLTNRLMVTETMPLNMRSDTNKNFSFDKLLNSSNSGSLTHHALTVEYTSNPAWYAVQALPYLIEYPYECAEQSFNRYYANTLAAYISNGMPKIRTVFEKWIAVLTGKKQPGDEADTAALLSNLQKNAALKSALLQETPWVLDAQNENARKKNMAILFDMVRLAKEKDNTLNKLRELQTGNGGFSWFKGGRDDRYITQYIITGIGHLRKLNALSSNDYGKLEPVIGKALAYLDARLKEEYDDLKKGRANLSSNNLSYLAIQYLYMHSFFKDQQINSNTQAAYEYYLSQSKQYWLSNSKYMQAMIALALYRTGDAKTPQAIIRSLKENAVYKEETGMYFKEFTNGGYYWYQSPIEGQALIIEAFTDIDKNPGTINDLKTWLLKQKQTQNWKTTKATAEACYALLLNGSNWLAEEKEVTVNLGNTVIKGNDTEAGTGYFREMIQGNKVQQDMGNIRVNIKASSNQQISKSPSWGAVYWQYFEDADKITAAETPLKLVKKLFIEKNTGHGPELQSLNDGDELKTGNKIKVRIELKADRDMEYIHMKDMRAACMEPVNVISEYKWQDGLGYYETTKDASTNFFFDRLPRGTYVFEYTLFVTQAGSFSNGITTIQCMYAPEFTSHSDGIRVNVTDK